MHKHLDKPHRLEIHLPESLRAKLDLYCFNPTRGKPDYGKRSALIQQLLRDFFSKQELQPHVEPSPPADAPLFNPADQPVGCPGFVPARDDDPCA